MSWYFFQVWWVSQSSDCVGQEKTNILAFTSYGECVWGLWVAKLQSLMAAETVFDFHIIMEGAF